MTLLVRTLCVLLLPVIAPTQTCPEETRVCPTDRPTDKAITVSPVELAYSKQVMRSRETPLGNLVASSSYAFLTAR